MKIQLKDEFRKGVVTVNKNVRGYFEILARAVSTDDTRKYLQAIWYNHETKELVSTDGRRLHILHADQTENIQHMLPDQDAWLEYDKGLLYIYHVAANGASFPNYRRVVPNDNMIENGETYHFIKGKKSKYYKAAGMNFEIAKFYCDYGVPISLDYLLDIQGDSYQVKADGTNARGRAVIFYNNCMEIVIMPFQYDVKRLEAVTCAIESIA
jgi:hypothetical protein